MPCLLSPLLAFRVLDSQCYSLLGLYGTWTWILHARLYTTMGSCSSCSYNVSLDSPWPALLGQWGRGSKFSYLVGQCVSGFDIYNLHALLYWTKGSWIHNGIAGALDSPCFPGFCTFSPLLGIRSLVFSWFCLGNFCKPINSPNAHVRMPFPI